MTVSALSLPLPSTAGKSRNPPRFHVTFVTFVTLLAALLTGCATISNHTDSIDAVAEAYVRMSLEAEKHEAGYVDAYYGPAEWKQQAEAAPRPVAELRDAATALKARLAALPRESDPLQLRRREFLDAQLTAAHTRLRMISGERLSFAEEARGLFGVDPDIKPLSHYDPILAEIERLAPGNGPLASRVDAFQNTFVIPNDRLDAVMRAAIAECRRRTVAHMEMPEGEAFTLEFVTGKSWSGYNYYQGNYRSLIQINTDLPVRLSRAVDLGCHEGYPGHHAYNALLERDLMRGRGWVEYSLYPLFSPQSFIAEGTANYGIDLAFPHEEKRAFERDVLMPLAGLAPREAARYSELQEALEALTGARFTIARDYLEGRITREQAIELTQRYQLVGPDRARQTIAFTDQYRSYVINYGLGKDMARRWLERFPEGRARWDAMRRILSEPTLPRHLAVPSTAPGG